MKMQTAITTKQAREICKGRTPLIPVEYETAVKALAECITLDEAKYWDNKADALAAWAKIYHSSEAERKAKQLKLHAYRRMGQIAGELRPQKKGTRPGGSRGGGSPGPVSLLREQGLMKSAAEAARHLALITPEKFNQELERPSICGPTTIHSGFRRGDIGIAAAAIFNARTTLRKYEPQKIARLAVETERAGLVDCVRELIDWLDAFEQALPKAKP